MHVGKHDVQWTYIFLQSSEWRFSLKGRETYVIHLQKQGRFFFVRMKVFPERDGNSLNIVRQSYQCRFRPNEGFPWKGWKLDVFASILRASETCCPNEGFPWKGWKRDAIKFFFLSALTTVRMKVFPERDGNSLTSTSVTIGLPDGPNEGFPWKGWKHHHSLYHSFCNLFWSEWRFSLKGMETSRI